VLAPKSRRVPFLEKDGDQQECERGNQADRDISETAVLPTAGFNTATPQATLLMS